MTLKSLTTYIRLTLVFLVGVTLVACQDAVVVQEVSQRQANRVVSTLNESGIAALAVKESGGRGRYRVEVKRGYYSQAVSLIEKQGLPGEERPAFSELVEPRGLLPNSRDAEHLRLDHALAVELEEVLSTAGGVSQSKALVRFHSAPSLEARSAVVSLMSADPSQVDVPKIRQTVQKSVPGILDENILVQLNQLPESVGGERAAEGVLNDDGRVLKVPLRPFLKIWRVPEDDYTGMAVTLLCCMIIAAMLGVLLGYWYSILQQSKGGTGASDSRDLMLRGPRPEKVRQNLTDVP